MAGVDGLLMLLIYLLIGGLIVFAVYWIVGMMAIPQPAKNIILLIIAIIILLIIAIIILIWLLRTFGLI